MSKRMSPKAKLRNRKQAKSQFKRKLNFKAKQKANRMLQSGLLTTLKQKEAING